jgi:hypothetical protein
MCRTACFDNLHRCISVGGHGIIKSEEVCHNIFNIDLPNATFLRDMTPHIGHRLGTINSSLVLSSTMCGALPTHLKNVVLWHRDFNLYWDSKQWKTYRSPSGYWTTQQEYMSFTWTRFSSCANVTRRTHLAAVRCRAQAWWHGLGYHSLDLSTSTPVQHNTNRWGE